jgi:hypothetical protein
MITQEINSHPNTIGWEPNGRRVYRLVSIYDSNNLIRAFMRVDELTGEILFMQSGSKSCEQIA